jgi:hypothetical protein
MRILRYVPKTTSTRSECVIPIAFLLQQLLHERPLSIKLNIHGLSWLLYARFLISVVSSAQPHSFTYTPCRLFATACSVSWQLLRVPGGRRLQSQF